MPQDPNLYGQRPPKKQKREMALSASLDFTSQLTSLISKPNTPSARSSSSTTGPQSSSSSKDAFFPGVKVKRKEPFKDRTPNPSSDTPSLRLKSPTTTEDEKATLAHARRKMEHKARLYAAMKRGDYVAKEGEPAPLVDFDRKWAQKHLDADADPNLSASSDSSSDLDEDYKDTEQISYTDEFGRQRTGTHAEKLRQERRTLRGAVSAAELEGMSARPRAPEGVMYGDAVQAEAFRPADPEGMAALARKRDRSLTPPPATHYEADREVRSRGTGFYAFSKDEATREEEMRSLEEERRRTEGARKERETKLEERRREMERRRREIGERKARKIAESFLDGLEKDFLDGGSEKGEEKSQEVR